MTRVCHRSVDVAAVAALLIAALAPPAVIGQSAQLSAQQQAMTGYWHIGRPPGAPGPGAAGGPPPGGASPAGAPLAGGPGPNGPGPGAAPAGPPGRGPGGPPAKLTPAAVAYVAKEQAAQEHGKTAYDPNGLCMPASVPGTYTGGAYQNAILVEPRQVTILFEDGHGMIFVHMNRPHPTHLQPSWSGDSIGHWEGNTLVIDSIGFNGKNLVPGASALMSPEMHIVQRLTLLPTDQIEAKVTFEDPEVLAEPISRTLLLQRGQAWQEYACQDSNLEGGYPTSTGQPMPGGFGEAHSTNTP